MSKVLDGLCSGILIFFALTMIGCSESIQEQKEEPVQEQSEKISYYSKDKGKWVTYPYDKNYSRVEIGHLENLNRLVLREHKPDSTVYAYVNDDYSYSILVAFKSKCKLNTTITTSKKFSDGKPKILKCDSNGESLIFEMAPVKTLPKRIYSTYNVNNTDSRDDLDGFHYDLDFDSDSWEFQELIREVTLNKAN